MRPGDEVAVAKIRDTILTMVKAVVDNEDAVTINVVVGLQGNAIFEVFVAENDMPYALGRHGQMIQAMRLILSTMCKKLDMTFRFSIMVLNPDGAKQ